jgi:diacylglycerol kinase (ATP)
MYQRQTDIQMRNGIPSLTMNERRLILNPVSGSADHMDEVRRLAADRDYHIEETEHEGHAIELGEEAVTDSVDQLAVAGGDGTLNEVVQGLIRADALDAVTLGVIPTGTENLFATNMGVQGIEHGFALLESGERRQIDLGIAGDMPFVTSCIAGLPADASVTTSNELKSRFGSLAFFVSGMQTVAEFDGLHLAVSAFSADQEMTWTGEALCVLIGNSRRFVGQDGQANVEDGLFDVVIIEQMPAREAIAEATAHRLFGQETEHVLHTQASQLEINAMDSDPIDFSLDGEPSSHEHLVAHTHLHALTICVGPEYESDPEYK